MKPFSVLFLTCCLLVACSVPSSQAEIDPHAPLAFIHLTLIDGLGNPAQPEMALIIRDSLIDAIIPMAEFRPSKEMKVVNASGKYAIPGLIDMHAHATVLPLGEKGLAEGYDREASLASLKTMLQWGITTIRNPAAPTKNGVELRDLVRESDSILSPEIFTAGAALNRTKAFFGPFVATPTRAAIRAEVRKQAKAGVDFIKVYSSLRPEQIEAAIEEAHLNNIRVIGHLQNTTWTEAAERGIDFISHAANWHGDYLPLDKQNGYRPSFLGRLYWLEHVDYQSAVFEEMFQALLENQVVMDPTLIAFHTKFWGDDTVYTKSPDLAWVHPSISTVWRKGTFVDGWTTEDFARAKKQWPKLLDLTRLMYEKGILLTAGSDFPNPWVWPGKGLHQELQLLHEAGIPPLEVIRIATHNGALALGIQARTGSLETGKQADFVLLNQNPVENIAFTRDIHVVYQAGKEVPATFNRD